jgi:hypothetical protein
MRLRDRKLRGRILPRHLLTTLSHPQTSTWPEIAPQLTRRWHIAQRVHSVSENTRTSQARTREMRTQSVQDFTLNLYLIDVPECYRLGQIYNSRNIQGSFQALSPFDISPWYTFSIGLPSLSKFQAPDPATIRPLEVLQRTLVELKNKWKVNSDYRWTCDQFKSLRQDLTVCARFTHFIWPVRRSLA